MPSFARLKPFPRPLFYFWADGTKTEILNALQPLLSSKAKQVILFGEARDRIEPQIGKGVPVWKKSTLREAVERAYQNAQPGDIVLLSPGCASFDEFANYKERGNYFKEVVRNL